MQVPKTWNLKTESIPHPYDFLSTRTLIENRHFLWRSQYALAVAAVLDRALLPKTPAR
jgi:hypothetical protein